MSRKPVSKNCRFCGKFMELCWFEVTNYKVSLVPWFYCSSCNEWDSEPIEYYHYDWLLFQGTINFKATWQEVERGELTRFEYFALLSDQARMKRDFENRPFLAIPSM